MSPTNKLLVYQFVVFLFSTNWNTVAFKEVIRNEPNRIKEKWEECCSMNQSVCFRDSCYTVERRPAPWAIIRDRCRSYFPDWPPAVDLLHITDQEEIQILHNLINKTKLYDRDSSGFHPDGIWTSGSCCPEMDSSGKFIPKKRWIDSSKGFPQWLNESIRSCDISGRNRQPQEECKFLVISPISRQDRFQFRFKDQREKYSAICQFVNPLPIEVTTEVKKQETSDVTTIQSRSINTDDATRSSVKDSTQRSSGESEKTSFVFSTSWQRTTKEPSSIGPEPVTTRKPKLTSRPGGRIDDEFPSVCKKIENSGILWPDTLPGETVKRPCPEGMVGSAEWTCDAKTLTFTPRRPHIQNCRHEWIVTLEKEVEDENKDAVELSKRIANKTTHTTLSHGDLSALVNLTEKLLKLFAEQRRDVLTSSYGRNERSYGFAKSMVTSYSYVLRSDVISAWTDLEQHDRVREASRIVRQMSETGTQLSCSVVSRDVDLQYTLLEENINLQTFQVDPTERDGRPYVFPKEINTCPNNTFILPGNLTFERWPPSTCKTKRKTAVGILYKNLEQFLRNQDTEEESGALVVSPIISFSLNNSTKSNLLPRGIFATIELERYAEPNDVHLYKKPQCVFWNFSLGSFGEWDSTGCRTLGSNESHTRCSCNHLTNFAIIMDINNVIQVDDDILEPMTLICCAVSTIALVLTCLVLLGIRALRCRRSTITCNLSFCLLIVNLLILFGFNQTHIKVLCAVLAGFMHFFVLAAFCWMLLEGFHLYQMVVLVFYHSFHISIGYFYSFGYGVPLVIVAISAAVDPSHYGRSEVCWLSNENGLMWSLVGPVALIICINFTIFIRTMKSASSAKIKREQSATCKAKAWLKGSLSIMCLLGLTWGVGFLYMIKGFYFTSYIFTALNGLQGVFIFVFHVLLNEKATNVFFKAFHGKIKKTGTQAKNSNPIQEVHNKRSLTSSITSITRAAEDSSKLQRSSNNSSPPRLYEHLQNTSIYTRNGQACRITHSRTAASRCTSYEVTS